MLIFVNILIMWGYNDRNNNNKRIKILNFALKFE